MFIFAKQILRVCHSISHLNGRENEIILYQPNEEIKLEVRLEDETVWLTQAQIASLFNVGQPAISKHLKNIYSSGELQESSTYSILEYMGNDGKQTYKVKYYNLDAILSIGYRVNSINATKFRQWANKVLKDYLLRGYSINQRFERLEQRVAETENKIDFLCVHRCLLLRASFMMAICWNLSALSMA